MNEISSQDIIDLFLKHLLAKEFPCVAAHEASNKNTIKCFVADHMACPKDDEDILGFLYNFVDEYRNTVTGYHSSVILFKEPRLMTEEMFDTLLWKRLQAIADLDAEHYDYDSRVSPDTSSPQFSFSIKEEAFYIIGMHSNSNRKARQFEYPALVFNPHAQFEKLREEHHYPKMQQIVRKRDITYSGSVNPMLADFGNAPEVFQYSGRQYDKEWKCPLNLKHDAIKHHPST